MTSPCALVDLLKLCLELSSRSCLVLYCIVPYCTVLYCIVLYCIVLYCIVLYCIVLYCIVLYCIVLYCIVSYLDKGKGGKRAAFYSCASGAGLFCL